MNNILPYEEAPAGSPDKYRITEPCTSVWAGAPRRLADLIDGPFISADGMLSCECDELGEWVLRLRIQPPFYFSVSVAPDDPRAEPAAATHDWIYQHSEAMAAFYGVPMRQILSLADLWFLALLRHYGFPYSSLYFKGVSVFGYAFHCISKFFSGIFK